MLKPEKYTLKQAFSSLKEARKGNGLARAIFRKWCDANAFPYEDEPECQAVKSYEDFTRLHIKIWYIP